MNRDKWEFTFSPSELRDAAVEQRDFRLSRVKAWTDAKEKVMAEVRESGVEISESAIVSNSYTTNQAGPRVMVRADLQTKLSECHGKIQEHAKAASEYAAWAQLFAVRANHSMMLTYADYLYFFPHRQTEAQL